MKKRNINLVIAVGVFLLIVIIGWFSLQSFFLTGYSVLEGNNEIGVSDFKILNLEKGDIISGLKTVEVQINESKYDYYEVHLAVNKKFIELGKGNTDEIIFFDIDSNGYENLICNNMILLDLYENGKKHSFYSDSFSIVNNKEIEFQNGDKVILRLLSEFGVLELKIKKNYEQIFYEDVRFSEDSVLMNKEYECAIDTKYPVTITFNSSYFQEPKMFLKNKECKSFCNILVNNQDQFIVELSELGNFNVKDEYEFELEINNPSRSQREYKVNEELSFYASLVEVKDEIKKEKIKCYILLEEEKEMEKEENVYFSSASFTEKGLFDWGVRCENPLSGYEKEKFGKFEIK